MYPVYPNLHFLATLFSRILLFMLRYAKITKTRIDERVNKQITSCQKAHANEKESKALRYSTQMNKITRWQSIYREWLTLLQFLMGCHGKVVSIHEQGAKVV